MSTKSKRKSKTERTPLAPEDYFDFPALKRVCEASENSFEILYDMERVEVQQQKPDNFYLFKDNGSSILAVAHLDTVGLANSRLAQMVETEGGAVVYSRALDDRLGAYVLAELLPAMGLTFDLLLTVGEESGASTAAFFDPAEHHDREYNWIIEFDRGGTDVVLYQYEDEELADRVEATGADVEQGIFSDISEMEHVGVKAMNWGVGYRDYHGPRSHVWLDDMFMMVGYFLDFHDTWQDTVMPHEPSPRFGYPQWGSSGAWTNENPFDWDEPECEALHWNVGPCSDEAQGVVVDGDMTLCPAHFEWVNR